MQFVLACHPLAFFNRSHLNSNLIKTQQPLCTPEFSTHLLSSAKEILPKIQLLRILRNNKDNHYLKQKTCRQRPEAQNSYPASPALRPVPSTKCGSEFVCKYKYLTNNLCSMRTNLVLAMVISRSPFGVTISRHLEYQTRGAPFLLFSNLNYCTVQRQRQRQQAKKNSGRLSTPLTSRTQFLKFGLRPLQTAATLAKAALGRKTTPQNNLRKC